VVNLLTRKWGHSIARGWARLLLERLRENVDLPADLKSFATNPDAIETEDEEEFRKYFAFTPEPSKPQLGAGLSHIRPAGLSWGAGPWPGPPLLRGFSFSMPPYLETSCPLWGPQKKISFPAIAAASFS